MIEMSKILKDYLIHSCSQNSRKQQFKYTQQFKQQFKHGPKILSESDPYREITQIFNKLLNNIEIIAIYFLLKIINVSFLLYNKQDCKLLKRENCI